VETPLGQLSGRRSGDAEEFLGIRYAHPPARFELAELNAAPWEGVREATKQGPRCWEPRSFPCISPAGQSAAEACISQQARHMSEDCLYLDLRRPVGTKASDKKATMVWIHGGGMVEGDSGHGRGVGNGSVLALAGDVIVVSVNYRLGPLGFLPVRGYGESTKGSGGMNGLHDQIVALRWVQANIGSFGGDPHQVTLFGCSAGSLSICVLSVSPLTQGLFQRVILESGSCLGPWGPGGYAEGEAVRQRLLHSLGNPPASGLLALHPWELLWGQGQDQYDIEFPGYWLDGWVAPEPIAQRLQRGHLVPDAFIIGANSRDGVVGAAYVAKSELPTSAERYPGAIRQHWRPANSSGGVFGADRLVPNVLGDQVLSAYPLERFRTLGGPAAAFKSADGDFHVVCAARRLALAVAAQRPGQVFFYYFSHGPLQQPECGGRPDVGNYGLPKTGWANHGFEQNFVFGNANVSETCHFNAAEVALSKRMQLLWTDFAKANLSKKWPAFQGPSNVALGLDIQEQRLPGFGSGSSLSSEDTVNCDFWDGVTQEYGTAIRVTA